ncbi:TPA: helix-turn-helix domain-containing protein, partial [Pseudomonas aeruginosa]
HAAESLGIHRNTVVYRLQAVEDILGKPIKEFDFSLSCALALLELKSRD